jgi:hypothetical protein
MTNSRSKKNPNAWILFTNEYCSKNRNVIRKKAVKSASKVWKEMSNEQKLPYHLKSIGQTDRFIFIDFSTRDDPEWFSAYVNEDMCEG